MREKVGDDFWLMWDCWMSLDLTTRAARQRPPRVRAEVARGGADPRRLLGLRGSAAAVPPGMLVSTGEHEATRYGFRMLLEMGCADILQPDVGWCGGITELIKISALPTRTGCWWCRMGRAFTLPLRGHPDQQPVREFLMMAPEADEVVPMFQPLLLGEPVPVNGRMRLPDTPGFGVELNPDVPLVRPVAR